MQRHRTTIRNQSGFGHVELLLTIIVVAVIAVAGLAVYQHRAHKPSSATSVISTASSQMTTQPATQYLTIKEWGIRVPYSGSLKLSYTMSSDDKSAYFSSDQLTALSSDCTGRGGAIIRWASTDQISEGPPDASTPTATKFFADKDPSTFPYAHIGNYYFMFAHAQSGCGDINTTAALQSQTNNAVKALVPHLQAVPSTQTDTQYLRIKEWGVRLSLTSDTASLYYYIKPSLPNVAYFSLKTISDIAPDCAADKISLGAIARLTEAEQQAATANPSALKPTRFDTHRQLLVQCPKLTRCLR